MAKVVYEEINPSLLPEGVRFDVPMRNQGQIVEIAYGGFSRAEHGEGDPYMRVTNRSDNTISYYKLGGAK